eukprot:gene2233-2407_t
MSSIFFIFFVLNLCYSLECPNQILYYVDSDPNQPKCGDCKPGTTGDFDLNLTCKINEYCTDNATCSEIKNHPLFFSACPYEPSSEDSNPISFCGPLHCYQHRCLPCLNGMKDIKDSKICYQNEWIYLSPDENPFIMIIHDPSACLLLILFFILLLQSFFKFLLKLIILIIKKVKKRMEGNTQNAEDNQNEDQIDEGEEEEEIETDESESDEESNKCIC